MINAMNGEGVPPPTAAGAGIQVLLFGNLTTRFHTPKPLNDFISSSVRMEFPQANHSIDPVNKFDEVP
jgi:hypothetical protein